jgi:hypothetical protein
MRIANQLLNYPVNSNGKHFVSRLRFRYANRRQAVNETAAQTKGTRQRTILKLFHYKYKMSGLAAMLMAGMGIQAFAEQPLRKGWQLGAAIGVANEDLNKWTNEPAGVYLEGSYQIPFPVSGVFARFGLGAGLFPGRVGGMESYGATNGETWKISLKNIQVNIDILYPVRSSSFSIVFGLSLNTWQTDASGANPFDLAQENHAAGTVGNAFGKYGYRLGLEYALNPKVSVIAMFQATELGLDREFVSQEYFDKLPDDNDLKLPDRGIFPVNPSWIQVGVRVKF